MSIHYKYVDLFCGIGSFHYSFQKFGWECVMACDFNKHVQNTYFANYGIMPLGDITQIDTSSVPHYDILCAGFPCQPFSNCGLHQGFQDKTGKGELFFEIMRFVRAHSPKFVILENVSALLNHDDGNTFRVIQQELESCNYLVQHKLLVCSDYGIPQHRKRVFIICVHQSAAAAAASSTLIEFDQYKKHVTLSDFLNQSFVRDVSYTIRCGGRNSRIGDRHNWSHYLVINKESGKEEEYQLTLQDALKLQGFDANTFQLMGPKTEQWRQLGNTIPTIFTEMVARSR